MTRSTVSGAPRRLKLTKGPTPISSREAWPMTIDFKFSPQVSSKVLRQSTETSFATNM